ncbi:hypothetical protein [Streptomyces sp. NPDC101165]|uniref:hypothetical protein n=1 Tax=Streptomyces sp. NPDC101165 TaxID=3366119 RepID=UPI003818F2B0
MPDIRDRPITISGISTASVVLYAIVAQPSAKWKKTALSPTTQRQNRGQPIAAGNTSTAEAVRNSVIPPHATPNRVIGR